MTIPNEAVERAANAIRDTGAHKFGAGTKDPLKAMTRAALEASGAIFLTDPERQALRSATDPNDRNPDVQSAREKLS